ncbi:MAG: HYR domain-containing protein, partial [Bacteroidetes bacterium]
MQCPATLHIDLPPEACETAVFFDTLSWSFSGTAVSVAFTPPSGTVFADGTHDVTLQVVDDAGTTHSCTFQVIVRDYEQVLACRNDITVTFGDDCAIGVEPLQVLEPGLFGCPDDYTLELRFQGQVVDSIRLEHHNKWLIATARDTVDGHSCWSSVFVGGDLPPNIACPPDAVIFCNEAPLPELTGRPDTTACRPLLSLTYQDVVLKQNCSQPYAFIIERTWTATDVEGHFSSCTQKIFAKWLSGEPILFPPDFDGNQLPALECNDSLSFEEMTDPERTGVPQIAGNPVTDLCEFSALYQDSLAQGCGGERTLHRAWRVVDWCEGVVTRDTQVIRLVDDKPPAFELPDVLTFSTHPTCDDSLRFPPIVPTFECSDFEVTLF